MVGSSVGSKGLQLVAGVEVVADGVGNSTAKDDEIQERVGTETVSAVDRHASGLTTSKQTRHNLVIASLIDSDDLASVASRDTTHVVVDGGQDRDGLLADIDTSKDASSLRDTGQALSENLGGQMAELEEDVVLVSTNTTAVADLHGHGSGDDVTRGKILGGRGITLHEALTLGVEEVTTLTTSTLGDQAASAIDTSGVELDKLEILVGETGTGDHGHAVTCAGVGRGAAEVGTSVTASGKDCVVGQESVQSAVLLVVGEDTTALAILHNQVEGEVLDEVVGVVAQGLAVQGVEEGVAGSVGGGTASVSLATLAVLLRLTTESSLVTVRSKSVTRVCQLGWRGPNLHLAFLGTGKGAAVVLELDNGGGSLTGHVVNGILVTEPVGALDGIVHVPSPVVLVHVAERGVDATLGGDGVGSGREELGDTGSVESSLGQAKGGTETGATGAYDEGIVFVVLCDEKSNGQSRVWFFFYCGRKVSGTADGFAGYVR